MLSSLRKKAARPEDHPRPCELTQSYLTHPAGVPVWVKRREGSGRLPVRTLAGLPCRRAGRPTQQDGFGSRHKTLRPRKVAIRSIAHHRELRTGMVCDFVPMTGDPGCPHLHGIRRESNHVGLVTRCEPS